MLRRWPCRTLIFLMASAENSGNCPPPTATPLFRRQARHTRRGYFSAAVQGTPMTNSAAMNITPKIAPRRQKSRAEI